MPKRSSVPDAYEAVFGALTHPTRRRVLLAVYFNGGVMSAGRIAAMFSHAWQTTTRHLQVLEGAGLLIHKRQGRKRLYCLERQRLALVSDWLAHFQSPLKPQSERRQNAHKNKSKGRQGKGRKTRET